MEKIYLVYVKNDYYGKISVDVTPCKTKEMALSVVRQKKTDLVCEYVREVEGDMDDFKEEFVCKSREGYFEIVSRYRDCSSFVYIEEKEVLG